MYFQDYQQGVKVETGNYWETNSKSLNLNLRFMHQGQHKSHHIAAPCLECANSHT